MKNNKRLNLNKYAFLDYLKGDIFAWLTNKENFNTAAEKDDQLLSLSKWRYKDNQLNALIPDQMIAGINVGSFAENWAISNYPNHKPVKINKLTNLENVEYTDSFLNSNDDLILFEASFSYRGFFIKTDILIKTGNSVKVVEVKAVTTAKEVHAWDLFFQRMIISKGDSNRDWLYTLLILSKDYRENNNWDDSKKSKLLFREVDGFKKSAKIPNFSFDEFYYDPDVSYKIGDFDEVLEKIKAIQSLDNPPEVKFDSEMWSYMNSDYMPWVLKLGGSPKLNSIFELKSRSYKRDKKIEGFHNGIKTIGDSNLSEISPKKDNIPSHDDQNTEKYIKLFLSHPPGTFKFKEIIQKHYMDSDETLVHKQGLMKELNAYKKGPIYMYDFEAADLAIPKIQGSWPYQHIPYQFSIHIITDPDNFDYKTKKNIIHREWIADNRLNFYEEFWKAFSDVFLEFGEGTYVSWNKSYEKRLIKNRKEMDWLKLSNEQESIIDIIHEETVDLMDPFEKRYYYHKDFHGSYSIKYVGPHFAPDLKYTELDNIKVGTESSAAAKNWLRNVSDKNWLLLRNDMLKYCEYDTLLMVAILQKVKEKIQWK